MDYFALAIQNWYLPRKAEGSRRRALLDVNFRRPLPVLGGVHPDGRLTRSTVDAINTQLGKLTYTSDPLWGADDYYSHPRSIQWRLENQRNDLPCDCDDYAVYAVALARAAGMNHTEGWVWNLIIDPAKQVSQAWANHVIAAFAYGTGSEQWIAVIDTTSAGRGKVVWFSGTEQSVHAQVIDHFNRVYSVSYYKILRVPYPFEGV